MRSENAFLIKASVKLCWFIKIWHGVRGGNGCTLPVYTLRSESGLVSEAGMAERILWELGCNFTHFGSAL